MFTQGMAPPSRMRWNALRQGLCLTHCKFSVEQRLVVSPKMQKTSRFPELKIHSKSRFQESIRSAEEVPSEAGCSYCQRVRAIRQQTIFRQECHAQEGWGLYLKPTPSRLTFLVCTSTRKSTDPGRQPQGFWSQALRGQQQETEGLLEASSERAPYRRFYVSNLISYNRRAKNTGHCTFWPLFQEIEFFK